MSNSTGTTPGMVSRDEIFAMLDEYVKSGRLGQVSGGATSAAPAGGGTGVPAPAPTAGSPTQAAPQPTPHATPQPAPTQPGTQGQGQPGQQAHVPNAAEPLAAPDGSAPNPSPAAAPSTAGAGVGLYSRFARPMRTPLNFLQHRGTIGNEQMADWLATESKGNLDENGRMKTGQSFRHPALGDFYVGKGEDPVGPTLGRRDQEMSRTVSAMRMGTGAGTQAFLGQTVDPYGSAVSSAGSAMLPYAIQSGNVPGAAVAVGMEAMGQVSQMTKGTLYQKGMEYAQLERPREIMSHLGIGTADRKGLLADQRHYGFSEAEQTYRMTSFMQSTGQHVSASMYKQLGEYNPEAMELKGRTPGTVGYFMSSSAPGGGSSKGWAGTAGALASIEAASQAQGLSGNKADEYLSRIAATLQGMGERGIKVDPGIAGGLANRLAQYGMAAGGQTGLDDKSQLLLQGGRAAQVAGGIENFSVSASGALKVPGMNQLATGILMRDAARQASEHPVTGRMLEDTQHYWLENNKKGKALDLYKQFARGNKGLLTQLLQSDAGGNQNVDEAAATANMSDADAQKWGDRHSIQEAIKAQGGGDVGEGQKALAAKAEEESKVVKKLDLVVEKLILLNETLQRRVQNQIETGAFLTGDKPDGSRPHKTFLW